MHLIKRLNLLNFYLNFFLLNHDNGKKALIIILFFSSLAFGTPCKKLKQPVSASSTISHKRNPECIKFNKFHRII